MDELKKKLEEVKKKLKPYNIVSICGSLLFVVGMVLTLVDTVAFSKKNDILFGIGLGIAIAGILTFVITLILGNKYFSEQARIKKEIKKLLQQKK